MTDLTNITVSKEEYDKSVVVLDEKYLIQGKSYKEWVSKFRIDLRPAPLPQEIRDAAVQLSDLYQEASDYKTLSENRLLMLKDIESSKYRDIFNRIVCSYQQEGKKLPAKDTLATITEQEMSEVFTMVNHAEIELTFWKSILNKLEKTRESLKLISISQATEAKAIRSFDLGD